MKPCRDLTVDLIAFPTALSRDTDQRPSFRFSFRSSWKTLLMKITNRTLISYERLIENRERWDQYDFRTRHWKNLWELFYSWRLAGLRKDVSCQSIIFGERSTGHWRNCFAIPPLKLRIIFFRKCSRQSRQLSRITSYHIAGSRNNQQLVCYYHRHHTLPKIR